MLARIFRRCTPLTFHGQISHLSTSPICALKQILCGEEGNSIVVEGRYVESPRTNHLFPLTNSPSSSGSPCPCPLCKLGLYIKHTDVLVLNQFVDSRGKQIPRSITGLCKLQFKRMGYLLVMAEKAGLMKVKTKEGVQRELIGWEALNKYYDDEVIEEFLYYKTQRSRA